MSHFSVNMGEHTRVVEWLLEPGQPWVRYNTLDQLLEKKNEASEALAEAMLSPPASKILDHVDADGGFSDAAATKKWGEAAVRSGYVPKYRGAAWKLLFLAELGADPSHPKVKALGEGILKNAFSERHGTFYIPLEYGGYPEYTLIPCFMGNMIWALTRLGFGTRPEVRSTFDWLTKYQRFDDGNWRPPTEFPYKGSRDRCWGRHTCYWGVTSFLRAMTVVPKGFWTEQVYESKRSGVDFILSHRLLWSSHTPDRPIATKNTRPQRLTAPQTYYQDAVEITETMLRLGEHGEAVNEAIEYVRSKRNNEDRWCLENSPGPLDAPFDVKERESKWITFRALRMLKLAGKLDL
jgi:hypothetical protein